MRWSAALLLALLASASFSGAHAACSGIGCSCAVNATPFTFGTYNPLSNSPVSATAVVEVECTVIIAGGSVSYDIQLDGGIIGTVANRSMSNGTSLLNYSLYTDASRLTRWGDGSFGTSVVSNAFNLGLSTRRMDSFIVHGHIPAGQNVTTGSYSDTVTITVVY